MKSIRLTSIFALAAALVFSGCATTQSAKKTEPQQPTPGSEVPADPPSEPAPSQPSQPPPPPPTAADSNQIIPLDKLPKKSGYPFGIKTKWPGLVKSPYAQDKTLVDVGAMASGTPVRCPHTGKIFIVP
ncbi:MAG: hypothetical protein PHV34_02955 [Verrucomicrobiae bacterium]|nr:hypothetical protein [Verrucomicrobiae bacterium]